MKKLLSALFATFARLLKPTAPIPNRWLTRQYLARPLFNLGLLAAAALLGAGSAFGATQVNVTVATGGSSISADTTSAAGGTGAYTTLTGPAIAETAKA